MNMLPPQKQQQQQQQHASMSSSSSSHWRKRRRTNNCALQRRRTSTLVGRLSLTVGTVSALFLVTSSVGAFITPTLPLHYVSHMSPLSSTVQHSTTIDTLHRPVRMTKQRPPSNNSNIKITPSTTLSSKSMMNQPLPTTTLDKSRTTTTTSPKLQRLSAVEQQELFRHVVEVRRIRKMELQLEHDYYISPALSITGETPVTTTTSSSVSAATSTSISMLEVARNTGYGTNVNELQTALIVGQQAREQLITTNMGLVHYCLQDILKSRTLRSITTEDLMQEGAIGLSRAVDKYNPSYYQELSSGEPYRRNNNKISPINTAPPIPSTTGSSSTTTTTFTTNAKFSTYAVYWIRAAMLRTISERDDIMRVPEHVTTAIRKISNVAKLHGYQLENDDNYDNYHTIDTSTTAATSVASTSTSVEDVENLPSTSSAYWFNNDEQPQDVKQMIVDQTGYSDQMVQNAMLVRNRRNKYTSTVLSYESWMQQGKHYETDNASLRSSSSLLTFDEPTPNMEHMKQTLSRFLRPKEMEALSWRYGLNDHELNDKDSTNPLAKRNYVTEAEIELFGSTSKPHNGGGRSSLSITKNQQDNDIVKGKWGEAMSFNDVGKQMQVSAEYGRRLCHGALEKLRRAVDDGKLEPALLY